MAEVAFASLPGWLLFLIIVGGSMALAAGALLLTRRLIKLPDEKEHNALVLGIFATVTLVYSVLVAFLVVSVWDNFQAANLAVSEEASAVITVAHDAELRPEPQRSQMLNQLHNYTVSVANDEWNTMSKGGTEKQIASPKTLGAFKNLWHYYGQLPPTSSNVETLRSLDELSDRRVLLLMSSQESLPGPFWFVLIIGAIVTIGVSLLLRVDNLVLHMVLVLFLTGLIALCLWLIVLINNPFVGTMQVSSESLKYALYVIDTLR